MIKVEKMGTFDLEKSKKIEIKQGREIIDGLSDKEKWQTCLEIWHITQNSICSFCLDNGIDLKKFLDFQVEKFKTLSSSPLNNPVLKAAIRRLPKNFMINQFLKGLVRKFQWVHKLKDYTLQTSDKLAILELKKCQYRKAIRKYGKKDGQIIPEEYPCYFCNKMFEEAADYGLKTEIQVTTDGCILKISPI